MKKFLVGLPIILIGLLVILLPGLILGEIGLRIVQVAVLIGALGYFTYVTGEEILEKIEKRKYSKRG
ncbi:Uncharacterised protein [[Clostridium] sordellii]|uniref:hypothetical protein n=1 Tax=Paraclostridium sordellii TaxID=1505 RepID=UPI0005E9FDED|nr:hypothetical protein [Paeniclostridium sordellii]CEQ01609.1 Uncharacterised protein [[Clostridium] sordellii] [Paeniclostridium sordellii]